MELTQGLPGYPASRVWIYDSTEALVSDVESRGYMPLPSREVENGLDGTTNFYGVALQEFIGDCRTLASENLQTAVERVEELAASIDQETLPQGTEYRRRRQWGKQGSAINPHRVLRGQLSTAWKRTRRAQSLGNRGVLTLVVPGNYSGSLAADEIFAMTSAAVALGHHIEQHGRRVELWAIASGRNVFHGDDKSEKIAAVRLKAASEPWSVHGAAIVTQREFSRRLWFRIMETSGVVSSGYGRPDEDWIWRAKSQAVLARYGVHPDTVIFGPSQHAFLQSVQAAQAWLQETLTSLQAEEVNA